MRVVSIEHPLREKFASSMNIAELGCPRFGEEITVHTGHVVDYHPISNWISEDERG